MQQKYFRAFAVTVSLAAASGLAFARTTPASAGRASLPGDIGDFLVVNGSVYNQNAQPQFYVIPMDFDNVGARTVIVRGKANSGTNMYCYASFIKPDGTVIQSTSVAFPANGTYTSINLSLGSVTFGSVGAVTCSVPGSAQAILTGIDYPP